MKKPESPCQNCIERAFACHDQCKVYKEFRKELKKYTDTIIKAKQDEFRTIDINRIKGGLL